jgi:flagellar protein FliS
MHSVADSRDNFQLILGGHTMISLHQNKYLETAVQTATPAQLLIMLCDGAIRFCKASQAAIEAKQYEEANRNLVKAQAIVEEFIITLDRNSPIADGLLRLYDYFLFRLREANIQKQAEPVEEVVQHLKELKETWLQASKMAQSAQAGVRHG